MSMFDVLNTVIISSIASQLKNAGFKKSGNNFYRNAGEVGWCFQVEKNQSSTENEVSFTFNVGIYVPKVYEILQGGTEPKFPKAYDCVLQKRITELKGEQGEHWYGLDVETDERDLEMVLRHDIDAFVMPFFRQHSTLEFLVDDSQNSLNAVNFAALLFASGRKGECEELIQKLYLTSTHSKKDLLRQLAERMQIQVHVS